VVKARAGHVFFAYVLLSIKGLYALMNKKQMDTIHHPKLLSYYLSWCQSLNSQQANTKSKCSSVQGRYHVAYVRWSCYAKSKITP